MAATESTPPRRRAVPPAERGRDADQTRERILTAALAEFGAKGYAGARTASIATRAGVNQQLIAYHFGGKQGLLNELRARWARTERTGDAADVSFAESVRGYLDSTLDNPDWARLVIWRALGDGLDGDTAAPDPQHSRLSAAVAGIAQRQRDGELTTDLDPEFILLMAYLLTFAPIALPSTVRDIYGLDPLSPDYRSRVLDQLLRVVTPKSQHTEDRKLR